jgi:dGTP triphosphohydrolase
MMMSHIDLNKEEFEIGQMCKWHPNAHLRDRLHRSVEVSVVAQYFGEDSITELGKDYSVLVRNVEMKDLLCWVRVQDLTKIIAST